MARAGRDDHTYRHFLVRGPGECSPKLHLRRPERQ